MDRREHSLQARIECECQQVHHPRRNCMGSNQGPQRDQGIPSCSKVHSGRFQISPEDFTDHLADEWGLLREGEEIAWRKKDQIVKMDGSRGSRSEKEPAKHSFKSESLSLEGKSSVNFCFGFPKTKISCTS